MDGMTRELAVEWALRSLRPLLEQAYLQALRNEINPHLLATLPKEQRRTAVTLSEMHISALDTLIAAEEAP